MEIENTDLIKIWLRVASKFKFSHGQGLYNSWVKPLELESVDNGFVTISSPTRFIKDWVNNNYSDTLNSILSEEIPSYKGFSLEVNGSNNFVKTEDHINGASVEGAEVEKTTSYEFSSQTDEKFSFKSFASNDTNKFAVNASKSIADKEDKNYGLFKSLFIYGGYGTGKTHLLQSVANKINNNKRDSRKAIYLSAEKFMFGFIKALRENDIINFKQYIRSADVLLIDDIQFICGKNNIQEEFMHSFNAIVESGNSVILACDRSADKLVKIDERLKARLCAGITSEIQKPDYELRLAALNLKAKQCKIDIDANVLSFIAKEVTNSIREAEGALNKIIAMSSLSGEDINIESTISWVKGFAAAHNGEVSFDKVRKIVCEEFNIQDIELNSKTRARSVARPRQIAMYLCKKFTTKSFPEIGRSFGGRDHATVIHSVKSVEKLKSENSELSAIITDLESNIRG